jgi:peptidyl-prolyl cis-trans isomerase C
MRRLFLLSVLPLLISCTGSTSTTGSAPAASGGDDICGAPADTSEAVQEAAGFKVSQLEWDAELLSIPERARARYNNDKGKQDISERILLNKALYAKAKEAGVVDDPQVQMAARLAAEKAYITALMSKVEGDAASDAAVDAHYKENADKYQRPMVRARHILVKEKALADDLFGQLGGGADFTALAKEHSQDRGSKAKGGELPWATRDRWVPAFADAAFSGEPNRPIAPVESKFGFHIIEVLEKRDMQPIEEVRPGIERVLTRNAVRDYREEVRKTLGLGPARGRPPVAGKPKVLNDDEKAKLKQKKAKLKEQKEDAAKKKAVKPSDAG